MGMKAFNESIEALEKLYKVQQGNIDEQIKELNKYSNQVVYPLASEEQAPHYFMQLTRRQALRLEVMMEDLDVKSVHEVLDYLIKKEKSGA